MKYMHYSEIQGEKYTYTDSNQNEGINTLPALL